MFALLTHVGRRSRVALVPLVGVLAFERAQAQLPRIDDRSIIDFGSPGFQVWGSSIAAGPRHRLAVCTSGIPQHSTYQPDTPWLLRAQTSREDLPGWSSAEIDPCPLGAGGWEWASVAYNLVQLGASGGAPTEGFLVAANRNGAIYVANYTPGIGFGCTSPCTGAPSGQWRPLGIQAPGHNYKSWVVAGEPNEFYIVASHSPPSSFVSQMFYARSTDGGCTWNGGLVTDAQGTPIGSSIPVQSAMASDGRIYLAHSGPYNVQFTKGEDSGALVAWTELLDESANAAQIVWSYLEPDAPPITLPQSAWMQVIRVPWLMADPTNAGRLYLLYHDSEGADPSSAAYLDTNVYVVTLRRDGANGPWHVSDRVKVNTGVDLPNAHSSQWLPAGAVDKFGRVHVIFYDNNSHGSCGDPAPGVKYDVYYALSTDHGETFTNYNLRTACDQRVPLDLGYALQANQDPLWSPHEYNGIAVASTDTDTTVWATYSGVSAQDPDAIKTVIYASKITLANP